MLLVLGDIYHRLGLQSERPAAAASGALALRRGAPGDDHLDVAEAEIALGGSAAGRTASWRRRRSCWRARCARASGGWGGAPRHGLRPRPAGPGAVREGRPGRRGGAARARRWPPSAGSRRRRSSWPANLNALGRVHHARADWDGRRAPLPRRWRSAGARSARSTPSVSEGLFNLAAVKKERGRPAGRRELVPPGAGLDRRLPGRDARELSPTTCNNLAAVLMAGAAAMRRPRRCCGSRWRSAGACTGRTAPAGGRPAQPGARAALPGRLRGGRVALAPGARAWRWRCWARTRQRGRRARGAGAHPVATGAARGGGGPGAPGAGGSAGRSCRPTTRGSPMPC